jgi:hypothetical protein
MRKMTDRKWGTHHDKRKHQAWAKLCDGAVRIHRRRTLAFCFSSKRETHRPIEIRVRGVVASSKVTSSRPSGSTIASSKRRFQHKGFQPQPQTEPNLSTKPGSVPLKKQGPGSFRGPRPCEVHPPARLLNPILPPVPPLSIAASGFMLPRDQNARVET